MGHWLVDALTSVVDEAIEQRDILVTMHDMTQEHDQSLCLASHAAFVYLDVVREVVNAIGDGGKRFIAGGGDPAGAPMWLTDTLVTLLDEARIAADTAEIVHDAAEDHPDHDSALCIAVEDAAVRLEAVQRVVLVVAKAAMS